MKNWGLYVGVVLTCVLCGVSDTLYALEGVGQNQLPQLENLTTTQRAALSRALNKDEVSSQANELPPASMSSGNGIATQTVVSPVPEIPRIRGGDTLLLHLLPQPAGENEAKGLQFPEKRIFVLDEAGGLAIPNFGRVILAGLTEAQAAERIAAEPALKGFSVNVKLLPVEQELKPFGYEMFQGSPDAFTPATDIPIPTDYVVGPGDAVSVQLFGKENVQYELVVTRDGTLLFPGIGPISVAGMTFSQLQQDIHNRVQKQLIGVQASVTLGRLRSIRIFVLGDVQKPGSYTVNGLSTLTNALFASGGVRVIGSLRDIQLKRQGKVITDIDIYDLLLRGDTRADVRLLPGDVIFVPSIGKTAGISGGVRRPAIYELKDTKTIDELITMAGGLLPDAFPQGAQIERVLNNRERILMDVDLTQAEAGNTALEDGDIVRIYNVLDKMNQIVTLSGHVQRPGNYQWYQGMRLTDLISSMSQMLSGVDGRYLLIKRENPAERTFELVSANLMAALQNPEDSANLTLQPNDEIHVFDIHGDRIAFIEPLLEQARAQSAPDKPVREVTVQGMVHHPGRYPLSPAMKLSDLLSAAGGLTDRAYMLDAELTRFAIVNGEFREQSQQTIDLDAALKNNADEDIALNAYDQISVRRVPSWGEDGTIEILGEVRFPGSYPVARGEKLSTVLERAGGVTKDAYLRGAVFLRESIRQREQEQLERLGRQLEQDLALIQVKDEKKTVAEGQILLGELHSAKAAGRMVIDLEAVLVQKGGYDVTLQARDKLYIPSLPSEVTVIGEVYFPTSHLHTARYDTKKYIRLSGGMTDNGNKKAIYVIHADGSVSPVPGWFSGRLEIGPGDTIVVPPKVERVSKLKLYTDISQVLYQLAVTAASLKVLDIF